MNRRTYGKLALVGDKWMMSETPPHLAIRLKQIFPRIAKEAVAPFLFPNDWPACADLAWFESRYGLEMSDGDRSALQLGEAAFEQRQSELAAITRPDYEPRPTIGLKEGMTVRPYQGQAIDLLMGSTGLLCGDEVGLGKTYITAGACLQPGTLPAAIVVQTHLQRQWAKKIAEFTNLTTHTIKGTKPYQLPPADIYLFRYSQLLGWIDTFEELAFKLVAFDEIQELRTGRTSGKGQAAKVLVDHAAYRLGLSATPIMGYGSEIWNIMQYINATVLGSFDDFVREWCKPGNGKWALKDPKSLGAFLREEHAFLRRRKQDVGQFMEPVNKIVETVDYDSKTLENAEALAKALAIKATTGSFEQRGRAVRELDIMMRQLTGVAKAKSVAAMARIIVEGGSPLVLVGWHREVYDIWLRELHDLKPVMYTGSESPAAKARAFEAFTTGQTDLFIMSLRSGAGLDGLQHRCSTMLFGELDWSPGIHHQCLGRLDREGQQEPVTGIFLVAEDGSDPPMTELLGLKASEASQVVDPSLGVQVSHSDVSKMKALVDRYLGSTKRVTAEVQAMADRRLAVAPETPMPEHQETLL